MSCHDFAFEAIDGDPLPLADFAGKPVLVVNTASECGYTPQYAELQSLWRRYRDRGLVVLGVPSNDFGAQEPGDEAAIRSFCAANYQVDFPMTTKVQVVGEISHPFYRFLVEEIGEAAAPRWNFHKYLIAPDGSLADIWPSKVGPLDVEIVQAIENLLPTG